MSTNSRSLYRSSAALAALLTGQVVIGALRISHRMEGRPA
jgi:hypothetical protein